jgi:DNA-directed RNA polymerase specialized sigma24 family protein
MRFPDTQWSLLAQATLHNESGGAGALSEFCSRYRPPIVEFIRRRGYSQADAEDLAHDFFIHVMEKSALRRAQEARGRFRSFLLGALVRFLGDAYDRRTAQKRGGTATVLSLDANDDDDSGIQPAVPPPDAELFDRQWALGLLALAIEGLEAGFMERGRHGEFAVLRAFIPGGVQPPSYEAAAEKLGMTLPAFKTEVHRLRARFRERLRREIAATVSSPEQVDEELAYLGRVLQAPAA